MSHPITMNWSNSSGETLDYQDASERDGTKPIASPTTLSNGGTSSVSADQTRNWHAGPVGNYNWVSARDSNKIVACSYVHPAGKGESKVTISCTGFLVSSDHETWF